MRKCIRLRLEATIYNINKGAMQSRYVPNKQFSLHVESALSLNLLSNQPLGPPEHDLLATKHLARSTSQHLAFPQLLTVTAISIHQPHQSYYPDWNYFLDRNYLDKSKSKAGGQQIFLKKKAGHIINAHFVKKAKC